MNRFKTASFGGFRRLYDLKLEMRPLIVLIGANGVGKSSLLDVFALLAASASGRLNAQLSELGGITSCLTYDKSERMSLSLEMEVPDREPLCYELQLASKKQPYAIEHEVLSQKQRADEEPFKHIDSHFGEVLYSDVQDRKLIKPTWDHNLLETSLSQVPKMYRPPEDLRRTLSSATLYHVLDVGPRSPVKLPQQMRPAELPGKDGEELVPLLHDLREKHPDRFEAVEDALKVAFPDFERLNFPLVAAGMVAMTWKDRSFGTQLYMNQLSEGTLRFLWLTALLQSPGLSTITMIDEPEVSLHPELLSLLAKLLREASRRTQIIVATHSDRLIRFLMPEEVLVMDIAEDGCATAEWADTLDLDKWLAEYTLDEVWQMGRMGGRA
ncbi:MAG: AAA family ATPase [Thermodesulfobacteriota bacterium]